ncbi:hypothetical protein M6B38_102730 [Iris pallida]|uniref:Secreted protein n=1 Tax=Iris pallida TaxID=29817 RepID=A0AAX6G779_IRIPA|nr:hypothetical protein M6B38_102730 [Iris pallida]
MLLAAHERTTAFCLFLLVPDPSETVRLKALGYLPSSSSFAAQPCSSASFISRCLFPSSWRARHPSTILGHDKPCQ